MLRYLTRGRGLKKYVLSFLPVFVFALYVAVFLPCCKRSPLENEIIIPVTSPLSREVIGYGVVNTNYTHILDERGDNGKSIGFLRKGYIVEILERRPVVTDNIAEMWVLASGDHKGWLKENELHIYPSKAQAVNASQNMPQ